MKRQKFSESSKKTFYENFFPSDDYESFKYDVGSYCTRKLIISQIKHNSGNLLEIGTGISSLLLDLQNFNCYGIDISTNTINKVKEQFQKLKKQASLHVCNAEKLPFKDNFFDVIVSSHTLEHIKNDFNVIKECKRILKNNGELIFFVPGKKSGLATKNEFLKYGHYRYYNLNKFKNLEKIVYPSLQLKKIFYPHKMHNLIWNRLKHVFRFINYPFKKWIIKDNKSYEHRKIYQKLIMPFISKTLDFLDKSLINSEKTFLGVNFNVLAYFEKQENQNKTL
ncbi:class I SAM-dependent methyltransferase [Candidatus Babeliales bacterium]|nr:class I SAM-dependent methyltransferase [Candidatus Babeliales bacterium]